MSYFSQEMKQQRAPAIKAICKKYNVAASLAVRDHRTFVLNIKSGKIDFIGNFNSVCSNDPYQVARGFRPVTNGCIDVNPYHYNSHFDGKALNFLKEVIAVMNQGNHDRSDIQTDYFDVGWYIDVNIGQWNKPYVLA